MFNNIDYLLILFYIFIGINLSRRITKYYFVKKIHLLIILISLGSLSISAQQYQPIWESIDSRPIPNWYKESKFGIFIHWGVYSVPAFSPKGQYAEWYQHALQEKGNFETVKKFHNKKYGDDVNYYQLAQLFKASLYNPDEWARLIEQSGAKYVVITSKHHDGFALWPSKEASNTWRFPWNAMDIGPKRDLLGDFFKAIRKTSVHAGLYYSLYEWYNPLWRTDKNLYVKIHMLPQMTDVINSYKPEILWTDGDWEASDTTWHSREFLSWLFNESKVKEQIVVNDRWGKNMRFHHGGIYTPEYQPELDFKDHYFEESRGMGFSYGYNKEEDSWDYNSAQVLILHLLDKVSRGGNFLLDIGPDADGKIPPIMQERLLQIGSWMKTNGEAIYGTHRWKEPFQWSEGRRDYNPQKIDFKTGGDLMLKLTTAPDPGFAVRELFFTSKNNTLYAISPEWPSSNKIILKGIKLTDNKVSLLMETDKELKFQYKGNNTIVTLPMNLYKIDRSLPMVIKIEGLN